MKWAEETGGEKMRRNTIPKPEIVSGSKVKTRLNMLFSPTLPAKTTLEVMLKMKMLSNENIIAVY